MKARTCLAYLCCGVLTFLIAQAPARGQVRVAVAGGGSSSGDMARDQLNDDTYFDFDAVLVSDADIDTLGELLNYNAVVLGGSGFGDDPPYSDATLAALRQYLDNGGGIVTCGWWNYHTDFWSGQKAADGDYISPILDGGYDFAGSGSLVTVDSSHDITSGIPNYNVSSNHIEGETAIDGGATTLGTVGGTLNVIVYQDVLVGRSVYLGGQYMANNGGYNTGPLRSGVEDQLFEQAVNWAANSGPPTPRCIYQVNKTKLLANQCGVICDACRYVRGDLVCTVECNDSSECRTRLKGFEACGNGGSCKVIADLIACDIPPQNCRRCR